MTIDEHFSDYREIHERPDDVNDDEYFERDNEGPTVETEDAE